ncbi:hypothetical protein IIA28_06695 [candidate division KSB1 bacterium]|nr:hypothetical protein [candidate division KSB1 bacterium]MCH7677134.1 hypothetical protein [candidate division KSB1 bacterium]MCH7755426.1 hypothetical protein [candidate division KSB1 bacterium]MCH8954990.1 hypothetical protein [candidate division KSB1 bacterium]
MEFHDLIPPIFEINELFAKKNEGGNAVREIKKANKRDIRLLALGL